MTAPLPIDLGALARLAEAATPGPWMFDGMDDDPENPGFHVCSNPQREGSWFSAVVAFDEDSEAIDKPQAERDARYIAAISPAVIRRLVVAVRAAMLHVAYEREDVASYKEGVATFIDLDKALSALTDPGAST